MGTPLDGSALAGAALPAGQTASVEGFVLQGTAQVLSPGSTSVTLNTPAGAAMGTLEVMPDGRFRFSPAAGYLGSSPAISIYMRSSAGRPFTSTLVLDVVQRECAAGSDVQCIAR